MIYAWAAQRNLYQIYYIFDINYLGGPLYSNSSEISKLIGYESKKII